MSVASRSRFTRDGQRGGERRSADAAKIEIELEMRGHAERCRDPARRVELMSVPLPVAHAERVEIESLDFRPSLPQCRNRDHRSGVQPLAFGSQRNPRVPAETAEEPSTWSWIQTPLVSGGQMNLCSWSWRRAGNRSSSIHSDRTRGSSVAVDWRHQHGCRAQRQIVAGDHVPRELVVGRDR